MNLRIFKKIKRRFDSKLGVILVIALSGLFALILSFPSQKMVEAAPPPLSPDTYIPKGYVLVPIEVQNHASLNSILGPYGVVDLFAPTLVPGQKPKKLAHHVKIIRAPRDPQQFAILTPEDSAPLIVKQPGPLFVVVQNPKQNRSQFIERKKKKSRIHFN